jgi:GDP-D-mannose dehydratase
MRFSQEFKKGNHMRTIFFSLFFVCAYSCAKLTAVEPDAKIWVAGGQGLVGSAIVREFVELAYKEVGIEIEWRGQKDQEYGIESSSGQVIVKVDPRNYHPSEVDVLLGNPEKAKKTCTGKPRQVLRNY